MKFTNFIKNNRFLFYKFLLLIILLGAPFAASSQGALNTVAGGFKANKNTSVTGVTVNAHGVCWVVKNSSTVRDYFIPTASSTEWAAFITRVPSISDLSLESCIQCTAGACCNIGTGQFYGPTQVCRSAAGPCDVAETCTGLSNICPTDTVVVVNTICDTCSATGASGACQLNDTGYRCTGTNASCGITNPYTCSVNAPVNDNVYNGSAWAAKSLSLYCNRDNWTCNGTQPRRAVYGCNISGGCNGTTTLYDTATSCAKAPGGEGTSVCKNGQSSCDNNCSDGSDNDIDGYKDGQDTDCGGCGECTSGACCNVSTGCYTNSVCRASVGVCDVAEVCTGASSACPTDSYANGSTICTAASAASGSCRLTGYKCTGSSSTCGVTDPFYTYTTTSGTVWTGSAWTTPPPQCNAGAFYCNGNEIRQYTLGCDTSGNCNVNSGSVSVATCTGAENSRCVGGIGTCQDLCSDGSDNDGDTWIDTKDTNCNPLAKQECSSGECCDTATGNFKAAGTYVANCGKCTGLSETPGNQLNTEDGLNECTSTTSNCQLNTCSGTSRACGYKTAGTTCNASAGVCDPAETCTGASYTCPTPAYYTSATICRTAVGSTGDCRLTGDKCTGTSATCVANPYYVNAPGTPTYPVYNGSSWISATQTTNCGLGPYYCNGNEIRRYYYGCDTSGSCNIGAYAGSYSVTVCGGGENSLCVSETGTCVNKCSNKNGGLYPGNDDADAYAIDSADPDCEPQCTSGDCCDITNGVYKSAGTVIGTCGKCTGNSNVSVNQLATEDLGSQCGVAGGECQSDTCSGTARSCGYKTAGTTCRTASGDCDVTDTCTGSSYTCADNVQPNTYTCQSCTPSGLSGACQLTCTAYRCDGTNKTCPVTNPTYPVTNGPASPTYRIWNASSWVTATWALKCGTGTPYCSGNNVLTPFYGCNTTGTCNTSTAAGTNSVSCGTGESAKCLNGVCINDGCTDTIDNDGDGWIDSADSDCGGSQQCSSGECCNVATSSYKPAGTYVVNCGKCTGNSATAVNQSNTEDGYNGGECTSTSSNCQSNTCSGTGRYCGYKTTTCRVSADGDVCDPAETCNGSSYVCPTNGYYDNTTVCSTCTTSGTSGSCALGGNGQYCSGSSSSCNGSGFTCFTYSPTSGSIWSGSSWVTADANYSCASSMYTCSGNTIVQTYKGCYAGQSACGAGGASENVTTCSGGENSRCVSVGGVGYSTCQDLCSDGLDNDSDGYTDSQDTDCGGSGQCTSGSCCNTATGSYKSAGTVCGTGSCGTNNYGTSGSCSYTYQVNSCSGASASCNGALVNSGATCYCPNGTVFNGTSCAALSLTNFCGSQYDIYCHYDHDTERAIERKGCNGSGSCTYAPYSFFYYETCSNGGYCYRDGSTYPTATCLAVACTKDAHCGTGYNSLTACGGTNNQQIGYVPYRYTCSNFTCYGPTAQTRVVTQTCAGRETNYCSYASCQNLCSNSSDDDGDGYSDANDTDCCGLGSAYQAGSHCALADTGCSASNCGSYSAGTYPFNRKISYYCQCEERPCDPGTYAAGGCCYPCPAGTYSGSSGNASCSSCPAGQWCPGGTSGGIYCPYGSPGSAAGADSCSDCYSGTGGS